MTEKSVRSEFRGGPPTDEQLASWLRMESRIRFIEYGLQEESEDPDRARMASGTHASALWIAAAAERLEEIAKAADSETEATDVVS